MGHIEVCMSQPSKSALTIRFCQCMHPSQQRWHLATACPKGIAHRTLSRRQRSDPPALRKSGLRPLSLRWYALFSHTGASSVTNDQHPHRIRKKTFGKCQSQGGVICPLTGCEAKWAATDHSGYALPRVSGAEFQCSAQGITHREPEQRTLSTV